MKQSIKAFLQLLIQDNSNTFNEGFDSNARQGDSFEEFIKNSLIEAGFHNFTLQGGGVVGKGLHGASDELNFSLIENFKTKRARNSYYTWFKNNLEDSTLEVLKTFKAPHGFMEQPLSNKRQPDVFVWWTNNDGTKGWLLIDVKTGGGKGPKLNDKEIGWNHLIIFNSRHKSVADRPTTITFARDLFSEEEYKVVEEIRQEAAEFKKKYLEKQKYHRTIRYNHRDRVEIPSTASNFFEEIEGKTREQREQLALESI